MKLLVKAPVTSGAGLRFRATGTRGFRENAGWAGRFGRWASSPSFPWPPLRLARLRCERGSVDVVCPPVLPAVGDGEEDEVRAVALDVHRDFCEVAIVAEGRLRSAGRIQARPEALDLFARTGPGRLGRAGGHRQRVGDRGDPRGPRRAGDRRLAH